MTIKILLADDHKVMRDGLRVMLDKELDMAVVAEAEDGHSAVVLSRMLRPDIIIIDIVMPGMNGIEATRRIIKEASGAKVIALSMHTDKWYVGEMLRAGALGYVQKKCAYLELVRAIRAVAAQKIYFCPHLPETRILPEKESSLYSVLTPRQREVLQLVAEGNSTSEIAALLKVSVKTIETHRLELMKKLNIHNIAGLTRYAIREGLIPLDF